MNPRNFNKISFILGQSLNNSCTGRHSGRKIASWDIKVGILTQTEKRYFGNPIDFQSKSRKGHVLVVSVKCLESQLHPNSSAKLQLTSLTNPKTKLLQDEMTPPIIFSLTFKSI